MKEKTELTGLRLQRSPEAEASIPQPPRKWLLRMALPVAILLVALSLLLYAARDSLRPAVTVETVPVVSKTLTTGTAMVTGGVTVQAPGWVEADPFPIYVPALAPGVVKEVLVLEGQSVEPGQAVARLIDDDARLLLQKAQAQLNDRQSQLVAAQAVLTAAQSDWDQPIEQDRAVASGQAKVKQVEAERIQWTAEIAMHEAKLAELEDQHRRLAALGENAASRQQVVQATLKRDAQQALLAAAKDKLAVIDARLQGAQADLVAAQQHRQLRIAERKALAQAQAEVTHQEAEVAMAEVAVAEAQLRLDRMEVRSPARGIVMNRLVVPGSKLMLEMDGKLSANAVHLYDPNKLQVRVDVPLADAAQVGIDQPAEITVDVLPETQFTGQVTRIVHEADIQKNTLEVKVAIHNPTAALKPEMLARVKFLGRSQTNTHAGVSLGGQRPVCATAGFT